MDNKLKLITLLAIVCLVSVVSFIVNNKNSTKMYFTDKSFSKLTLDSLLQKNHKGYNLIVFLQKFNTCCFEAMLVNHLDSISKEENNLNISVILPDKYSESDIKNIEKNFTFNLKFYRNNIPKLEELKINGRAILLDNRNSILFEKDLRILFEKKLIRKEIQSHIKNVKL